MKNIKIGISLRKRIIKKLGEKKDWWWLKKETHKSAEENLSMSKQEIWKPWMQQELMNLMDERM